MSAQRDAQSLALEEFSLMLDARVLIRATSLIVQAGEIVSLRGASGAGKSSLLSFLCGVLPWPLRAQGRVRLGNRDVTSLPPERRRIGILLQDDLLFPHLNVGENLAFGLRRPGATRRERGAVIRDALASVGLSQFAGRDPATLSSGERARVALLRVLLSQPAALLLDEPFARLDGRTRDAVRGLLFDEVRRRRLPTLMVTHDDDDATVAGGRRFELFRDSEEGPCSMRESSC
jgi:putative thiamine transport system ATP-binding protein